MLWLARSCALLSSPGLSVVGSPPRFYLWLDFPPLCHPWGGGEERNWAPVPQAAPSRSQEALVAPAASLWGGAVGSQPRADPRRGLFSSQQAPWASAGARRLEGKESCGADLTFLAEDLCSDQFPSGFGLECLLLFSFLFFFFF